MDFYDCLQIRSNVACFSALIGDSDLEEFPYLPKTRNLEAIPVRLSSSQNMAKSSTTLKLKQFLFATPW